jgi:hypothetical protein
VDPSGHDFGLTAFIVGSVIGAISSGSKSDWDLETTLVGGLIGGFSGYVGFEAGSWAFNAAGGGTGGLLTGGTFGGAVGGGLGGGLSASYYGGDFWDGASTGAGYGGLAGLVSGGLISIETPPLLASMGGGFASGYAQGGVGAGYEGALYALASGVMFAELNMRGLGADQELPEELSSQHEQLRGTKHGTYVVTGDREALLKWKIISMMNDGFTHTMHTEDKFYWAHSENAAKPRYIYSVRHPEEHQFEEFAVNWNIWKTNCTTRYSHLMPGTYNSHNNFIFRSYWYSH